MGANVSWLILIVPVVGGLIMTGIIVQAARLFFKGYPHEQDIPDERSHPILLVRRRGAFFSLRPRIRQVPDRCARSPVRPRATGSGNSPRGAA